MWMFLPLLVSATFSVSEPPAPAADLKPLVTSLQSQIQKCLSVPPGSPQNLPLVRIELRRDGSLASEPVVTGPDDDAIRTEAGRSLVRAITRCAPYKIEKRFAGDHDAWKTIVIRMTGPPAAGDGGRSLRGDRFEIIESQTTRNGTVKLGPFTSVREDCTIIAQATAQVVARPRAGRVDIALQDGEIAFAPGHAFESCNDRLIRGTMVTYAARRGFVGSDEFQFSLRFPDGEKRRLKVKVQVR
jgi:hypothetical protein